MGVASRVSPYKLGSLHKDYCQDDTMPGMGVLLALISLLKVLWALQCRSMICVDVVEAAGVSRRTL